MMTVLFHLHGVSYEAHKEAHFTDNKTVAQGGKWQSQNLILVDFCRHYHCS